MDSPFKDILYTNTVPSDTECDAIRVLLEDPRKEAATLTEELCRLDALRKETHRKRRQLKQFIDAHLALLSPVRRLPEDILRSIFVACLPSTRNPALSGSESPLLLSQICSFWRKIALSTPRLWASIHIVVPNQTKLTQLRNQVGQWLNRSGIVPLSISMVFSQACEADCDISPLLSALVAVSRRWKDVQIALPNHDPSSPLLSVSAADVPLLQSFTITALDRSLANPSANWRSMAFLGTTSLRSVTLPATNSCRDIPVTWGCLTRLKITGSREFLAYPIAIAILQQCPLLHTCDLTITDTRPDDDALLPALHPQSFTLANLSHLGLSITEHNHTERPVSFSHIAMPNLRSFHCQHHGLIPTGSTLGQMFPTTGQLETLKINMPGVGGDALLAALAQMPLLRELAIDGEPYDERQHIEWWPARDEDFLARLAPSSDRNVPVICPRLRSVEISGFSAVSDETLLEFVRSRTAPQIHNRQESRSTGPHVEEVDVTPLTSAVLTIRRPMQFDILPPLHDAVAAGLFLSLRYDTPFVAAYSAWEGTEQHMNSWNQWPPMTGQGWQDW
ncbi:hypothetical protein C8R43DRAFT_969406 [Mycena crocata]|nr:hypothetical protein C8R43DRAFT_969406 [Mycena crocata]